MIHRMDPPADPDREPMPEQVVPMLARARRRCRADDERWAFEIKWDGVRAIAYSEPGRLRFQRAQPARHHAALSRARAGSTAR